MMTKVQIYLGSPFFNDDQNNTVSAVENLLDKYGFKYYSPRKEGGVYNKDASPEEREKQSQAIYDSNMWAMRNTDLAICNIDDRDTGTAWEYGWFNGKSVPALTFSGHGYGCNIMLAKSGIGHCKDLVELEKFLSKLKKLMDEEDSREYITKDNPRKSFDDLVQLAIKEIEVVKGLANE